MAKVAGVAEVMRFFEYDRMADFRNDWRELSEAEKEFFRTEVGKAAKAGK